MLTYLDFDKMLRNKHKGLILVRTPGKTGSEEEAYEVPTEKNENTRAEGEEKGTVGAEGFLPPKVCSTLKMWSS